MSQYIESEKVELKVKYTDTICKYIVAFCPDLRNAYVM